ncbi:M15 family metallopeptidase [Paenibacillus sp. NPDC058071]|uniref:M15 family metallopeptidase n=1 Tax=Paenibacillus sp. NPDC058071 TaxID=3346326 RepID=UPI0036DD1CDF
MNIPPNQNWPSGDSSVSRGLVRSKPKKSPLMTFIILMLMALVIWSGVGGGAVLNRLFPDLQREENVPVVVQGLHPVVEAKKTELVARAADKGIRILITDGFRSHEEQNALYEQGRSAAGSIVTHAKGGDSFHNYGLAIDFAIKTKSGKVLWDLEYDGNGNGKSDWMEVVEIAKKLGFAWGGDWEGFRDYPHFQMDFGYTIRELKRGKMPPVDIDLTPTG